MNLIYEIKSMEEIYYLSRTILKDLQTDYGFPYNTVNDDKYNEYIFSLVYLILLELGFYIKSKDENVNIYLRKLEKNRVNGKYRNYLK
ncbi:MAG: hypothetical protein E7C82_05865 [Anaerococcus hydrogenalis]|uniref:hypothetical protein n=1 Tax=Anaerococcus hydrogenalis TaxID=33029 RepID=UPI002901B92E|nr:hypothetical protein [Anaerococcus hydrogenalis]MDU2583215.1 hypothetical protein [Anaerococcus hydrogenalis]